MYSLKALGTSFSNDGFNCDFVIRVVFLTLWDTDDSYIIPLQLICKSVVIYWLILRLLLPHHCAH